MRYVVEGPDGKRYIVEGPSESANAPGATHATPGTPQGGPDPSEAYPRAGGYGPYMAGVADSGLRAYYGGKQFLGGLSAEDRAVLREMNTEAQNDPSPFKRTAGDISGNLALTAVPASKLSKTLNTIPKIARLGRLAPAVTGGAVSGATEFALAPGEGEGFGEQMLSKSSEAAKAAAIGGVASGLLSGISRPFKPSKEADDLMKQGVYPTLQQGSDTWWGKNVGALSGGAGASSVANRQNKEVVQAFVNRVVPGLDTQGMTTAEVVNLMDDFIKKDYDKILLGKKYRLTPTARQQIWKAAQTAAGREPDVLRNTMRAMGQAGNAVRSPNNVVLSAENMKSQRNMIQDQINAYSRDPAVKSQMTRKGLIAGKDKFDELVRDAALSPDEFSALRSVDKRNFDAVRFAEAAESPSAQEQMRVSDLLRAYKNLDPKGGKGFARAEADTQRELLEPASRILNLAGQDDTRAGLVALKRAIAPWAMPVGVGAAGAVGGPAVGAPLAAGYGLSLAGQTKKGARALFGDYELQRKLAEELRKRGGASAIGSALTFQSEE